MRKALFWLQVQRMRKERALGQLNQKKIDSYAKIYQLDVKGLLYA